jgi:hypothetical protein
VVELAALFKDYGLVGVIVALIWALKTVTTWWKDSMDARLADQKAMAERAATALERQAQTNADVAENMKEVRDGQGEILKVTTEAGLTVAAGLKETNSKLSDLRGAVARKPSGATS